MRFQMSSLVLVLGQLIIMKWKVVDATPHQRGLPNFELGKLRFVCSALGKGRGSLLEDVFVLFVQDRYHFLMRRNTRYRLAWTKSRPLPVDLQSIVVIVCLQGILEFDFPLAVEHMKV